MQKEQYYSLSNIFYLLVIAILLILAIGITKIISKILMDINETFKKTIKYWLTLHLKRSN